MTGTSCYPGQAGRKINSWRTDEADRKDRSRGSGGLRLRHADRQYLVGREAVRNGVEVERPPGTPATGVGAEWRIRGHFKGKARKALIRIEKELAADQRLALGIDSPSMEAIPGSR